MREWGPWQAQSMSRSPVRAQRGRAPRSPGRRRPPEQRSSLRCGCGRRRGLTTRPSDGPSTPPTRRTTASFPQVVVFPLDVGRPARRHRGGPRRRAPRSPLRGGGTSVRRQRDRPGRRGRLLPAPERDRRDRPRGAYRRRPARRDHVQPAGGRRAARAAVRPGPLDPEPRDPRRHDRQQRRAARTPSPTGAPPTTSSSLDVVDGTGPPLHGRAGDGAPGRRAGLDALVTANLAPLRTELGRFGRQVSGYSLEHLLPEKGTDLAKALVGTEGTARRRSSARRSSLVPIAGAAALVVLGYPDMPSRRRRRPRAARAPPARRRGARRPAGRRRARRHQGAGAVPRSPPGAGWLMVEMGGDDQDEALARAPGDGRATRARRSSAGPAGRAGGHARCGRSGPTAPGSPGGRRRASRPGRAGRTPPCPRSGSARYLREFDALHGRARRRRAALRALRRRLRPRADRHPARDVRRVPLLRDVHDRRRRGSSAAHGGSLSGEHGDGRARCELLPRCTPRRPSASSPSVKHLFDPAGPAQPGRPRRPRTRSTPTCVDPTRTPSGRSSGFASSTTTATSPRPCTGASGSASAGRTRPPPAASCARRTSRPKDEKDVTRGPGPRAAGDGQRHPGHGRLAIARGPRGARPVPAAARRARATARPGVDMAQYKSEVLHRTYRRPAAADEPLRARLAAALDAPRGSVPRWRTRPSASGRWPRSCSGSRGWTAAGRSRVRDDVPFRTWWARRARRRRVARRRRRRGATTGIGRVRRWSSGPTRSATPSPPASRRRRCRSSQRGRVRGRSSGRGRACCGLTWICTGQLDGAQKQLLAPPRRPRPVRGQRHPDRRGSSRRAPPPLRSDLMDLLPRRPACARRRPRRPAPSPSCSPRPAALARTALAPARPDRRRPPWRSRTATSYSVMGYSRPTCACCERRSRRSHARGLLRSRRQLRQGAGALRGLGRGRRECAAARTEAGGEGASSWPTASRAGRRPTTSQGSRGRRSPSCSPAGSTSTSADRPRTRTTRGITWHASPSSEDTARSRCTWRGSWAPRGTT